MLTKLKATTAAVSFVCLGFASASALADCELTMTNTDGFGTAEVEIDNNDLNVKLTSAIPNTLYTVWVTFSGSPDRPPGASGSAPAFAVTAPVYNGMRTDENGFFTDNDGDGILNVELGYDLLATGAAPVVNGHNKQGDNRVSRDWLRVFANGSTSPASVQVVDVNGTPLVQRATATGLAVVSHPDNTTHGGSPGVGGVDQNGAFNVALSGCTGQ